jgi:hypothetical protein
MLAAKLCRQGRGAVRRRRAQRTNGMETVSARVRVE